MIYSVLVHFLLLLFFSSVQFNLHLFNFVDNKIDVDTLVYCRHCVAYAFHALLLFLIKMNLNVVSPDFFLLLSFGMLWESERMIFTSTSYQVNLFLYKYNNIHMPCHPLPDTHESLLNCQLLTVEHWTKCFICSKSNQNSTCLSYFFNGNDFKFPCSTTRRSALVSFWSNSYWSNSPISMPNFPFIRSCHHSDFIVISIFIQNFKSSIVFSFYHSMSMCYKVFAENAFQTFKLLIWLWCASHLNKYQCQ